MIERRTLLALAGTTALATLTGAAKAQTSSSGAPVATTKYGKVRGATSDGIHVFKGVRYGASTAGANRFRPPKPPAPWSEVRDALDFAPMSPQAIITLGGCLRHGRSTRSSARTVSPSTSGRPRCAMA